MKKNAFLILSAFALLGGYIRPGTPVAAKAADTDLTLKVYSWEDYIYEQEADTDPESMIKLFENWYPTTHGGQTVTVEYSTFDTNETMYNQVAGLGESYDLLCPSDYMIQKMAREGLLTPYPRTAGDYDNLPNYNTYASPYLRSRLEGIAVDDTTSVADYAAGYMWGTMGLIYNPEQVESADMNSWSALWDSKYAKQASVKDSMRETYLVGLIETFKTQLDELRSQYLGGLISATAYNAALSEYLNRRDQDTVDAVEANLLTLKKNIYGLEVDSGKNDIVTGKVDINVAWSGDAVYSMDEAENLPKPKDRKYLKYSVPEEGSNVWFDGWVMPTGSQTELAQSFVDFLSDPTNAILNMDYIGYTSFIAGEAVLQRVKDLYGVPSGSESLDLSYFFTGTVEASSDMVITTDTLDRQLVAQYPSQEIIVRCAVMEDFGVDNARVVEMWSNFKATTLGLGAYIGIGAAAVALIAVGVYFFLKNRKSQRHQRQKARHVKK